MVIMSVVAEEKTHSEKRKPPEVTEDALTKRLKGDAPSNCLSSHMNEEITYPTDINSVDKCSHLENNEESKFNGIEISKLTKRQLKKYKKCLKWQETKKEKRAKQRLKNKEKKIHAKLNNIDLGPSRKVLKRHKMSDSPCKISVCIDLSFDHLMIDKDMAKTIKQILRIYTENRRAKAPMQLYLCDFNGRSVREMQKHDGYEHWDINFEPKAYTDVFPKDKLIYLTSESDNVITQLEPDKVYIIGGLVDHNSHKAHYHFIRCQFTKLYTSIASGLAIHVAFRVQIFIVYTMDQTALNHSVPNTEADNFATEGICYEKAVSQGINHAQLPIGEYFQMNHRKVLTINQVFEILLRVSEGKLFKEALKEVIPKRTHIKPNEEVTKSGEANDSKADSGTNSNSVVSKNGGEQGIITEDKDVKNTLPNEKCLQNNVDT